MKITEITYSMSVTRQISDYEPMNVHYSMKAEVDGDWKEDFNELRKKVRAVIKGEDKMMEMYKGFARRKPTASQVREYDEAEKEFIKSLE